MKPQYIILLVVAMLIIGLVYPLLPSLLPNVNIPAPDNNYLLTVISIAATMGGITVALYGWYAMREIPKQINREIEKLKKELHEQQRQELYRIEEATQKMMAAYSISEPDRKISLLHEIIELHPDAYNAYITLAYTYWYQKNDLENAEFFFKEDLERHPHNYQALCDLAALHISKREYELAKRYMEKAQHIRPDIWDTVSDDQRFDPIRP